MRWIAAVHAAIQLQRQRLGGFLDGDNEATYATPASAPTACPWQDGGRRPDELPVALPERPKIALVEVSDPAVGHQDVVVYCPGRDRYLRIQGPQWAFLRSLDGTRTIAELEGDLQGRLPRGMVRPLLSRFAELGLLEGDTGDGDGHRPRGRRLQVPHAGVIQLTLMDPDKLLSRLIPVIRLLGGPAGRSVSALVAALGLWSMVIHAQLAALAPERLEDPAWLAALVAAVLLACVLHELGHASAVKYYGGRVRRMGLMLFYLVPAMFCDTSDAWRFPHNRRRAIVALAGIWVQMVLAGLAQIVLWLPVHPEAAVWLWLFSLINICICVVNLFPFIKLDGYWVLTALTGMPNLRACALTLVRQKTLRLITGITQPQTAPLAHPVLTVAFGLGCLLFPPLLIMAVLLDYQHTFLQLGRVGAAAWLILAGNVIAVPRKGLFRTVRSASGWPRRAQMRAGLVASAAALVVLSALAVIRIPLIVQGRYELSAAGEVVAILSKEVGPLLSAGDRVQLRGSSAVDRALRIDGALVGHAQSDGDVLRYQVALDNNGAGQVPQDDAGSLSVLTGEVTAPAWFWATYTRPALSSFWG